MLSKSKSKADKQKAIELLRTLLTSHDYRIDVLYALGECHYSLGEYEIARNYSEELLRQNPDSSQVIHQSRYSPSLFQARTLQAALIEKQREEAAQTEETLTWIAVGVGIAAVAGLALAKSLKR